MVIQVSDSLSIVHMFVNVCVCVCVCVCSLLRSLVKSQFKEDFSSVFKHLASGPAPTEDDMRSLLFGDYMKPDAVSNLVMHCS